MHECERQNTSICEAQNLKLFIWNIMVNLPRKTFLKVPVIRVESKKLLGPWCEKNWTCKPSANKRWLNHCSIFENNSSSVRSNFFVSIWVSPSLKTNCWIKVTVRRKISLSFRKCILWYIWNYLFRSYQNKYKDVF